MTTYYPLNTSGRYAYVHAQAPGKPVRCVDCFNGPDAFERAVKRARELNRQSAPAKVGG